MAGARVPRSQRRVLEATAVASILAGAPSLITAFSRDGIGGAWHYGLRATRAVGALIPPGRPNLLTGVAGHFAISTAAGEVFGLFLPQRHSVAWGAAGGAVMGLVNVGLIGRRFPAIRELPFGRQVADNIAFGVIFAVVADRGKTGDALDRPLNG
jgi:hypothetical protein